MHERILSTMRACSEPRYARDIACAAGLGYKPVVDMLDKMRADGSVERVGKKRLARWRIPVPSMAEQEHAQVLANAMRNMVLVR